MSAANLLNTKAAQYAAVAAVAAVALYFIGKKIVGAAPGAVGAAAQAVNPVNPNNVFASGVNAVGGAVSGQGADWSLGSWIYDLTHAPYDPNAGASPTAQRDAGNWWDNLKERIW